MRKRESGMALVMEMPSSDLERARRLILISLGFWLCVGVLAALQHGVMA